MKNKYLFIILVFLFTIIASCEKDEPQPVANFTMSKTSAEVDETIAFTNLSENATSYTWDFGDGKTSIVKNPYHSYSSDGDFTVTLTAIGDGGENSLSKSVFIEYPIPIADFTMDTVKAYVDVPILFTNTSKNASGYEWDFGDGNVSTEVSPSNIYTNDGTYKIKLKAIGNGGIDTISKSLEIVYPKPVASFVVSKTVIEVGDAIQFTNNSLYATSYKWEFGDGNESTEINPAHTYESVGKKTIILTAYYRDDESVYTYNINVVETLPCYMITGIDYIVSTYPGGFNESIEIAIWDYDDNITCFSVKKSGLDFVDGFPLSIYSGDYPVYLNLEHKYKFSLSINGYYQGYADFIPNNWIDHSSPKFVSFFGSTGNSFYLYVNWYE